MTQLPSNHVNNPIKINLTQNLKKRIIATISIKPFSRTINEQHFLIQSFKKQLKQVYRLYDRQAILQCVDYLKVSQVYDITIDFINPYELISKILISKNRQEQTKDQSLNEQKVSQKKNIKIGTDNSFLEKVYWLLIINGSLQFHGVRYEQGQNLFLRKDDIKFVTNVNQCQYIYLNNDDLEKVAKNYQFRQNSRYQFFAKNVLLYNYLVSQQKMAKIFNQFKVQTFKNKQIIHQGEPDEYIRILYKGVLQIQVEWKRTIRLCQLTPGSTFNGPIRQQYLKKPDSGGITTSKFDNSSYPKTHSKKFFTSSHKKFNNNHEQQVHAQKFRYVCVSEQATVIYFHMNLLEQSPLNINTQLKQNLLKAYQNRVKQIESIKKQPSYNRLHRMQKSYELQMLRNKQKLQAKKNITQIQYLQDKSIRQRFFTKKGKVNLLQKPQSYRNNSSQKYLNPRYRKIQLHLTARVKNNLTKSNFFSQQKRNKTVNVVQVDFPQHNYQTAFSTIGQPQPFMFSTSKSPQNVKKVKSFSTLRIKPQKQINSPKKLKKNSSQPVNLFVPEQFVNRKLRLQFESILKNVRTLPIYENPQKDQNNIQKQIYVQNNKRFQNYIQEKKVMNKRIMKYYGNSHKYLKK